MALTGRSGQFAPAAWIGPYRESPLSTRPDLRDARQPSEVLFLSTERSVMPKEHNNSREQHPLHFKFHASRRMLERNIPPRQVENVLRHGRLLRRYPQDDPRESYLMLGKVRKPESFETQDDLNGLPSEDTDDELLRPVHVVATDIDGFGITAVITVYVPDEDRWEDDYRWKKSWSTTQHTWREYHGARASVSGRS